MLLSNPRKLEGCLMAIFFEKENSLQKEFSKVRKDTVVAGAGILFSSCISLVMVYLNIYLSALSFLLMLFFLYRLTTDTKNIEILRSGVEGEKKTQKIFSRLSDEYYVYSDLKVIFEGNESQLDHVIVGPNGVFVIESKNIKGTIKGKVDEKYWIQEKTGSGGGNYKNEFYSPLKQVGTHVYRLSGLLKKSGVNIWIESGVFFSNSKATLSLDGEGSRVFSVKKQGAKEMIDFIKSQSRLSLSEEDINEINDLLREQC